MEFCVMDKGIRMTKWKLSLAHHALVPGNRELPNAAAQSELSILEQHFSHYTYSAYFRTSVMKHCYMYVCMYMHTCSNTYTYVCAYIFIHIYIYIYTHIGLLSHQNKTVSVPKSDYLLPDKELHPARRSDVLASNTSEFLLLEQA